MFKKLYPGAYVESVFSIDYRALYNRGYRGIMFDIDNTLVPHGQDATKEIEDLFREIHEIGFKTLMLSNNSEERIQKFLENIDSLYIYDARKPSKVNYLKAVEMLGISKEKTICIGDQIFTDVYGANRSGIDNILVKYIRPANETKIGKRRTLEKVVLRFYQMKKVRQSRKGNHGIRVFFTKLFDKNTLFCDINPTCYAISLQKEICKRHLKNLFSKERVAKQRQKAELPNIVSHHSSHLIKRGKGIDVTLQENKAVNINLACAKLNGMIINPGEVFSFWQTVGKTTKRKGYKDGRVMLRNDIIPGIGGGLCNLGNTIHLLILHSPLDVVEFHSHSDALAPDEGKRIPFSSGTSIAYNHIDYRFKNNTNQRMQLLLWCDADNLYGELRSERPFPCSYELVEKGHHFKKEGKKYYRISKIYKKTVDRESDRPLSEELVLDNHSEVMFDWDLIPEDQIVG